MKNRMIILSLGLGLVYACGSSSSSSSSSQTVDPHSAMHQEMHTEAYREAVQKEMASTVALVAGTYSGKLPCSTCKGILLELNLLEDFSFEAKKTYQGTPEEVVTTSGTFSINADWTIDLSDPTGSISKFKKTGDDLLIIDQKGNLFENKVPEGTLLYKVD